MEFYKIFRLKRQLNGIFFIVFFGTSVNFFFNFIIYRKLNKLINKLNKDTITDDK